MSKEYSKQKDIEPLSLLDYNPIFDSSTFYTVFSQKIYYREMVKTKDIRRISNNTSKGTSPKLNVKHTGGELELFIDDVKNGGTEINEKITVITITDL